MAAGTPRRPPPASAGRSPSQRRATRLRRLRRTIIASVSALTVGLAVFAAWNGLGQPTTRFPGATAALGGAFRPADDPAASGNSPAPHRRNRPPAREVPERSAAPTPKGPQAPGPTAAPSVPPTRRPSATPSPTPTKLTVMTDGPGIFIPARSTSDRIGTGPLIRYRVEVERGLPFSPSQVASVVDATLADPRSWAAAGKATFQRVGSGDVDMRILVSSPGTTDDLCAPLRTRGWLSCRNGDKVVLNAKRWAFGAAAFSSDVANYRRYVVNHEVGHRLGYGHLGCPDAGQRAPVMMQQTKGVGECRANPWPLPSELD
jgi:Protein of unknown function (DUF3152)